MDIYDITRSKPGLCNCHISTTSPHYSCGFFETLILNLYFFVSCGSSFSFIPTSGKNMLNTPRKMCKPLWFGVIIKAQTFGEKTYTIMLLLIKQLIT